MNSKPKQESSIKKWNQIKSCQILWLWLWPWQTLLSNLNSHNLFLWNVLTSFDWHKKKILWILFTTNNLQIVWLLLDSVKHFQLSVIWVYWWGYFSFMEIQLVNFFTNSQSVNVGKGLLFFLVRWLTSQLQCSPWFSSWEGMRQELHWSGPQTVKTDCNRSLLSHWKRKLCFKSSGKEKYYLATLLALVSRQISPKYDPSLREVATSPFCITMSTIPSWMKYIFVPIVPSLIMISPGKQLISFHHPKM